jgi:peptidase E
MFVGKGFYLHLTAKKKNMRMSIMINNYMSTYNFFQYEHTNDTKRKRLKFVPQNYVQKEAKSYENKTHCFQQCVCQYLKEHLSQSMGTYTNLKV